MANFGDELVVVNDDNTRLRLESQSVARRLLSVAAEPASKFLYFHPRVYLIEAENPTDESSSLPFVEIAGRGRVRALVFPERHTLWFARGAVLQLARGVVVIIRGSIIADPTQIFDLPEVRARLSNPTSTVPAGTALVRFESTRIEEIYPEWFGVVSSYSSTTPAFASAGAAAYQACLHAAMRDRDRDGVSLPPLTVVSNGVYSVNETLEALPDVNGRGALWMSGSGDATRRGLGIPSLNRYPRGASQWAREPNGLEDDRSALLRLHPKVSAEISGVGFRCFEFAAGDRSKRDVAHALLIEEATTPALDPLVPGRHVRLERCGLTGGREAVVGLKAGPSEGRPAGLSGVRSTRARARVSRHAARYSMESCLLDAVLSAGSISGSLASLPTRSSRHAIHLDSTGGALFELMSSLVFQTKGAYFDRQGRPVTVMDLAAGIWVRGVSACVRAVSFHLGEGPRPSRAAPATGTHEKPDGQDLWLASDEDGVAPHLTVLHADSQSWWHLGADPIRRRRPGAVCLLNVGAGDVNLRDLELKTASLFPLTGMTFRRPAMHSLEERRLFTPPSVWWPDSEVPLVLVGCAFKRYAVRQSASSLVMNVGSSFTTAVNPMVATWLSPAAVPRPLPGDLLAGIREGRAIPEAELVSDRLIAQGLPVLVSE